MFDIGLQEMVIIGVIALLVFGPSKLPELGRMVGRAMRELRRMNEEFRSTVETNLHINEPDPVIASPSPYVGDPPAAPSSEPVSEAWRGAAPPPAPAPAGAAAVASEPGEPFCAQRGSRLFHRRECDWVRRIPEADRVEFKQISDARDQGFRECPVCAPWEPA
jgi:sec-independent protein translocase protein TatA